MYENNEEMDEEQQQENPKFSLAYLKQQYADFESSPYNISAYRTTLEDYMQLCGMEIEKEKANNLENYIKISTRVTMTIKATTLEDYAHTQELIEPKNDNDEFDYQKDFLEDPDCLGMQSRATLEDYRAFYGNAAIGKRFEQKETDEEYDDRPLLINESKKKRRRYSV